MDENGNGQFVEETEDPIVGADPPPFEDEEEVIVPDNSYESVDGFDYFNRFEIPKMTLCYANSRYLDLENDVWDFGIDQSTAASGGTWARNKSYGKGAVVRYNNKVCKSLIPSNIYEPNTTGTTLTRVIGEIVDKDNEELVINFNQTSTLSFRVYKITTHSSATQNKISKRVYDNIKNRKAIFVEGLGYFIITEVKFEYNNGQYYKDVEATSAEVELQNKMIPYIGEGYDEEGTTQAMSGTFAFRDLLTRLVTVTPKWTIGYIDNTVSALYRTFDDVSTDTNILSFMLEDMQEAYECVFTFDIINREINAYAQSNYINNTNIHLTTGDLVNKLTVEEKSDDIYTVLEVECDDDLIVFDAINPTQDSRLYDFTYYLDEMSSGLRTKVINYQNHIKNQMKPGQTNNYYYYAKQKWMAYNNQMMQQCEIDKADIEIAMYDEVYANLGASNSLSKLDSNNDDLEDKLRATDKAYAVDNNDDYYARKRITIGSNSDVASTRTIINNMRAQAVSDKNAATTSKDSYAREVTNWNNKLDSVKAPFKVGDGSIKGGYFTEAEFEELSDYIAEGRYSDKYVIYTDEMNWVDKCEQLMEVYTRAREQLDRVSMPVFELNIDAEDFVFEKRFKEFTDQLDVGKFVHIEIENNTGAFPSWSFGVAYNVGDRVRYNEVAYRCKQAHTPSGSSDTPPNRTAYWEVDDVDIADMFLNQITINYFDNSLKMRFGSRYSKMDNKSLFEETLGKINKTANSVNYMTGAYELIAGNYNDMAEKLQNSRNLSMKDALESKHQEIVINEYGFTGRKLYVPSEDAINYNTGRKYGSKDGVYDNRQVKLVNNLLVFTSDGWENCDVAIGELKVQQLKKAIDGNGNTDTEERNVYGINAKYIVGDMIIGNGLRIYDNRGRLMFGVNEATGTSGGNIDMMVYGADDDGNPITYGLSQTLAGTVFYDSAGKTSVINGDKITAGSIRLVGSGDSGTTIDFGDGSGMRGKISGETVIDGDNITTGSINADLITTGTLDAGKITVENLSADYIDAGILHCDVYDGPVNSETHIYPGSGGGAGPVMLRGTIDNNFLDIENLYVDDVHLYDELIVYDRKRTYAKNAQGKRYVTNSPKIAGRIKFIRGSTDTETTNGVTIIPETSSNRLSITNGGCSVNCGSVFNINENNITLTAGNGSIVTNGGCLEAKGTNSSGQCFYAHGGASFADLNVRSGCHIWVSGNNDESYVRAHVARFDVYENLPSADLSGYATESWVNRNFADYYGNGFDVKKAEYSRYADKVYYPHNGTNYFDFDDAFAYAYSQSQGGSDRRIKKEIDYDSIPDYILDEIKPATFRFNDDRKEYRRHIGVIAQDVIDTLNNNGLDDYGLVYRYYLPDDYGWHREEDERYAVRYQEFIPLLIKRLQKQQATIDEQQNKIDELEERLAKLEALIN